MSSKKNDETNNGLRQRKVAMSPDVQELSEPPSDEGSGTGTVVKKRELTMNSKPFKISWPKLLQVYSSYVANSYNQDKLIKTIQYSLWMLSRFYRGNIREALTKLSGELLWARYATRLVALPTALEGIESGSWGTPKALGKAMAWSMLLYYPLEYIAYVKWKAPQLGANHPQMPHRLAERASAWSCRCWVAYIVLDIVRSTLALRPTLSPSSDTQRNERLQIVRNALFFFPALSWSLPNWDTQPWLSDITFNSLMWLESVVCMYQSLKNLPSIFDS